MNEQQQQQQEQQQQQQQQQQHVVCWLLLSVFLISPGLFTWGSFFAVSNRLFLASLSC